MSDAEFWSLVLGISEVEAQKLLDEERDEDVHDGQVHDDQECLFPELAVRWPERNGPTGELFGHDYGGAEGICRRLS